MPQRKPSPAEIQRRRAIAAANLDATQGRIVAGVQDLVSSDSWPDYLGFASNFHQYSFNNSLLIYVQNPDATYVAGYQSWLKLGRQVRKGEKGISVLAPVTRRQNIVTGSTHEDDKVSEQLQGPATIVGVKNATIFDVSQTDPIIAGEESPLTQPALLQSDVETVLWWALTDQVMDYGFVVERGDCGPVNGITDYAATTIRISEGLSDLEAVKALAHELGHVILHDPRDPAAEQPVCEGTRKVEAESVAFMVLTGQGLGTANYEFPPMGDWAAQGNDAAATVAVVRDTGNKVIKASREILEQLEPVETMEADKYAALMSQAQSLGPVPAVTQPPAELVDQPAIELPTATYTPEDLYAVNAATLAYFQDFGREELAAQYLATRGIESINPAFSVGYAPAGGGLVQYLEDQGFETRAMIAAGVARVSNDETHVRDVFRDRIMVGVRDGAGNLAGFVGRAVKDSTDPKYMNTRATDVFDKSRLLIGLAEGAQRLKEGATPVLIEGPFDVLAVAQYPSNLVPVAGMGTAVTRGHVLALGEAMGNQPRRGILGMDDDPAGRQAAYIGAGKQPAFGDAVLDKFVIEGWQMRAPRPTGGLDPADIAKLHGDKVIAWLSPAKCQPAVYQAVEERFRRLGTMDSLEQRAAGATELREYLGNFPASAEREHAIGHAHDLCRVSRPEAASFLARDASAIPGSAGASVAVVNAARDTAHRQGIRR